MRTKSKVLSPFGKLVRKIRVDNDETMCTMAKKLKTNTNYLCIIEHGQYSVPEGMIPALVKLYNLDQEMRDKLVDAASIQQKLSKIHLEHCDEDVRRFVLRLADAVNNRCCITKKHLDQILTDLTC